MSPLFISAMTAVALFCFCFFFISWHGQKTTLKGQWLFDNFFENLTSSFLKDEELNQVARKLSIATDKYFFNCAITRQESQLKKVIGTRIFSIALAFISIILSVLLSSVEIVILGLIIAIVIFIYLPMQADRKAKKRKKDLEKELPRFLDLLKTALQINLPVDQAIEITARHIDSPLSDEFLSSLAETKLGTKNWQSALQNLAQQYEIDDLSDFILDIIVAYDKGVPVYDVVAAKATSMKQMRLLNAKEKAARLTSTIVIPMFIFKIIPLLVIMALPLLMAIDNF